MNTHLTTKKNAFLGIILIVAIIVYLSISLSNSNKNRNEQLQQSVTIKQPVEIEVNKGVKQVNLISIDKIPFNAEEITNRYWRKDNKLYFNQEKNQTNHYFLVNGVNADNFKLLQKKNNGFFFKDDLNVFVAPYLKGNIYKLEIFDANTIEVIKERSWPTRNNYLLKDNKNVYNFNEPTKELQILSHFDTSSFEIIPTGCPKDVKNSTLCLGNFFSDNNGVYNINLEPIMSIENLDPKTTELLELTFLAEDSARSNKITLLRDPDTVYRADYGRVLILYPSINFESFKAISDEYQKDNNNVYYTSESLVDYEKKIVEAIIVKDADPDSFVLMDWCGAGMGGFTYFASDKMNIYSVGKKFPIDKNKFKILGDGISNIESAQIYFTDGNNVYRGCTGIILPNLNPNEFEIVERLYVKDKYLVYNWKGELMKDINPDDCIKDTLEKCNPNGTIPF